VTIRVLQGERQMANDNTELGRFDLIGIPPAPRGVPQIEVTFDIDQNGIVHVSAKDKGTGKEQSIKISAPKKLSDEEIQKMIKEAEKFAEEDKRKKEEVELINQANTIVYATEKSLKDYGDKVSSQERGNIEVELNSVKDAIKNKDTPKIKQGMESLQKASHKLAEEIYKSAGAAGQAQGGEKQAHQQDASEASSSEGNAGPEQQTSGGNGKDDIIDADFKAQDEK